MARSARGYALRRFVSGSQSPYSGQYQQYYNYGSPQGFLGGSQSGGLPTSPVGGGMPTSPSYGSFPPPPPLMDVSKPQQLPPPKLTLSGQPVPSKYVDTPESSPKPPMTLFGTPVPSKYVDTPESKPSAKIKKLGGFL